MKAFFQKYNTLRNQIFLMFFIISIVAITTIGFLGFNRFASVYDELIEQQLEQTSVEVNSAMESKYAQISTIAAQISTDKDIQQFMYNASQNPELVPSYQQPFNRLLSRYYPYIDSVDDFRFFSMDGVAIFPNIGNIERLIDQQWVDQALAAKGQLIWAGQDSKSSRYSYAIKVIRIIDHGYSFNGFFVMRLANEHFNTKFADENNFVQVYDGSNQFIAGKELPKLLNKESGRQIIEGSAYYVAKGISQRTNWTVYVAQSMQAYNDRINAIKFFVIGLVFLGIFLCFNLAWLSAKFITFPLERLIIVMKKEPKKQLQLIEETNHSSEMRTLHRTYNQFITDIEQLIEQVYEKQLSQQQAELKALQSQINPHFLYNTLNTFYWKLIDDDQNELADYVLSMSALFKYSVGTSGGGPDVVTLRQEIEHIEHYLNLMKMRMENRLTWRIDMDSKIENVILPKLILQPLVENAIIHGIEPRRSNGQIFISIQKNSPSTIQVKIEDNGTGITADQIRKLNLYKEDKSEADHIGIDNIRTRLAIHYGVNVADSFHFESQEMQGTLVTMILPIGGNNHDDPNINR